MGDMAFVPVPAHLGDAPPMTARLVAFVGMAPQPGGMLTALLSRSGVRSLWLAGVDDALAAARHAVFDAVVLDAGVVAGPGAGRLAQMRTVWQCPILLATQQADEIDEIVALELGADAYLVHPIAPHRMRAHLNALMRLQRAGRAAEAAAPQDQLVARFEGWQLERSSGVLQGDGRRVDLPRVQASLLACLMDAAGQTVPRAELVAALPRGPDRSARCVDVYMSRLRQRLDTQGVRCMAVHVVRGYGYKLHQARAEHGTELTPM